MKHVSIIGKFLSIMACFGLFSVGMALYSGQKMADIDTNYSALLDHESKAALYLARSNRSLQAARAALGDMMMSDTRELNEQSEKDLKAALDNYVKYMGFVAEALPGRTEIGQLKADGLKILNESCAPAAAAGRIATTDADVKASQTMFLKQCQPLFAVISPRFTALTDEVVNASAKQSDDLTSGTRSTIVATLSAVGVGLILGRIDIHFIQIMIAAR